MRRFALVVAAIVASRTSIGPRAWAQDPAPPAPLIPLLAAQASEIDDIEDSLAHDHSYKVRVDAALVLGRLRQPRSIPALVGALKDPHPAVRASAARSLGLMGSPSARDAVAAAARDPVPVVRHMAREALRRLGGSDDDAQPARAGEPGIRARAARRPSFEVKAIGDPGHRAGPALQSHMRDFLIEQLRPIGDVSPGEHQGTYVIDGVIKTLAVALGGRDVEVSCTVQLVVSKQPSGGVFLMTNGEATVQKPRRQWRPQLRSGLEMEALEAAVRGASEDLVRQLAPQ